MSLSLVSRRPRVRLTEQERERLRIVAEQVASAARMLLRQGRTRLDPQDLNALGTFAVWSRITEHDPARSTLERWSFMIALNAMSDASRADRRDTLFQSGLRRGMRGYAQLDDRPVERDFHRDTPETDLRRVRHRSSAVAAAAVVQAHTEQEATTGQIEAARLAGKAAWILREERARLSDEQRRYLTLRFWDEAETGEIAKELGVSVRTLHRRWVEVQDLLRARLAARGVTSVPEGFSDATDAMALREGSEGEGRAAGADVGMGERGGITVLRAPKKDGGERA